MGHNMVVKLLKIYKILWYLFLLIISKANNLSALHKRNEEHFLSISIFSRKMKRLHSKKVL